MSDRRYDARAGPFCPRRVVEDLDDIVDTSDEVGRSGVEEGVNGVDVFGHRAFVIGEIGVVGMQQPGNSAKLVRGYIQEDDGGDWVAHLVSECVGLKRT